MSNYPDGYPESESAQDYLDAFEKAAQMEAKLRRMDEGVLAYEKMLSEFPTHRSAVLTPMDVMGMLGSIVTYTVTGRRPAAMQSALERMGR